MDRFDRRLFVTSATSIATSLLIPGSQLAVAAANATLGFPGGERRLVTYPEKRPLLLLTERPPQLETPFSIFNEGAITPNNAFFVRYHLAGIPTDIDPATFRLNVTGKVGRGLSLSLDDLRTKFVRSEVTAVNQCSGNSRGFSKPRVGGGQLGNGAMGNAVWSGVSLKAVLEAAGIDAKAKDVVFRGMDAPVLPATPDFAKSLSIDHALDGTVLLAFAMNGTDLPMLNGYPLRLVVPGYFGTYWVKHLNDIEVVDSAFDGFWMKSAYRLPDNECFCVEPGTTLKKSVPIAKLNVRSFITSVQNGAALKAGSPHLLRGIAFDGGSGIKDVAISQDGGTSWRDAKLGRDLGVYSFREWSIPITFAKRGEQQLMVRSTSRAGETQPPAAHWNPAGYRRNGIETVSVRVL